MLLFELIAHLQSWPPHHRCSVRGSLAVDPSKMFPNILISSDPGKRTLESSVTWNFTLSCCLLFCLFLFFAPLLQPQYKSAWKTMWALAVTTVSFEWWIHTRHGHYKSCLCGTLYFFSEYPQVCFCCLYLCLYYVVFYRIFGSFF